MRQTADGIVLSCRVRLSRRRPHLYQFRRKIGIVVFAGWLAGLGLAQVPPSPGPPAKGATAESTLKIVVLQGEGTVNDMKTKAATDPVVEVRDYREAVVSGAQVTFSLPYAGASGTFRGSGATLITVTNEQGQAAARGFTPNDSAGRFNIKVTVTEGLRSGSTVISQRNASDLTANSRGNSLKWKIAGLLVGAGASVGTYAVLHRGGSTPAAGPAPIPSSLTVSAGTITISGPR